MIKRVVIDVVSLRQRLVRVKQKNKRTFCFKNQYAFSWHIKING